MNHQNNILGLIVMFLVGLGISFLTKPIVQITFILLAVITLLYSFYKEKGWFARNKQITTLLMYFVAIILGYYTGTTKVIDNFIRSEYQVVVGFFLLVIILIFMAVKLTRENNKKK